MKKITRRIQGNIGTRQASFFASFEIQDPTYVVCNRFTDDIRSLCGIDHPSAIHRPCLLWSSATDLDFNPGRLRAFDSASTQGTTADTTQHRNEKGHGEGQQSSAMTGAAALSESWLKAVSCYAVFAWICPWLRHAMGAEHWYIQQ